MPTNQAHRILGQCGITPKLGVMSTHDPVRILSPYLHHTSLTLHPPTKQATPLSSAPGMELAAVAASLKAFYSALFALEVPAFARLMNPRLQGRARKGVAEILATAYEVRAAWFVTLAPALDV